VSYVDELFRLDGRGAVVIGGTGVLCGAIAEGFARAGAKVVIVGRSQEKADARIKSIQEGGGEALFVQADVTTRAGIESALAAAQNALQAIDVLVNGAGVNSATPYQEISEEEWQRIFDTNLKSVFLACQIFGKVMLGQEGGGSIINITSMAGMTPLSRVFTYSATKAALINLTQNLAREWATRGVRVNGLAPGFFPAEQNRKVLTPDRIASIMGHTPMDRFGEADELIGAALLLASRKAGSFITGSNLVVDGGYSCMTI
jgi:NAD(P)-dependent dehydrogenase (short-subunit alcohol dehydrogenase family)